MRDSHDGDHIGLVLKRAFETVHGYSLADLRDGYVDCFSMEAMVG